mmetsp:Transcript_10803/g.24700  ORF Transcript_10803/g.24700 Transcript_10803/m.24700 type:complete len:786 (+) Transcript_10803:49-2406(+)
MADQSPGECTTLSTTATPPEDESHANNGMHAEEQEKCAVDLSPSGRQLWQVAAQKVAVNGVCLSHQELAEPSKFPPPQRWPSGYSAATSSSKDHQGHARSGEEEEEDDDFSNFSMSTASVRSDKEEREFWNRKVFADVKEMKDQVRQNLCRPKYDVCNLYKTTGVWQAIARSSKFEHATLTVIGLNSIWIAVDADFNSAPVITLAHPAFQAIENLFCLYFVFEWTVRFMAFAKKRSALSDFWFTFDSTLAFMMAAETWAVPVVLLILGSAGGGGGVGNASILRMARLLRLTRMARIAHIFHLMPELLILIKGMVAATRSVFFTLCLLFILLYVFGIAFRQLTDGSQVGEEYFSSVFNAMYTLLIDGVFMDDVGDVVHKIGHEHPECAVLFWTFVLLSSLTVMNMLIGVLCEVVSAVAATERETLVVSFVKEKLHNIARINQKLKIDQDDDGSISKSEFLKILKVPEAAQALHHVGVDVVGLVDSADAIFDEDGQEKNLTFEQFMEAILQLRGSNNATVKDIVDLRKLVRTSVTESNTRLQRIEEKLADVAKGRTSRKKFHAQKSKSGSKLSGSRSMSFANSGNESRKLKPSRSHPSSSSENHALRSSAAPSFEELRSWMLSMEEAVVARRSELQCSGTPSPGTPGDGSPSPKHPLRQRSSPHLSVPTASGDSASSTVHPMGMPIVEPSKSAGLELGLRHASRPSPRNLPSVPFKAAELEALQQRVGALGEALSQLSQAQKLQDIMRPQPQAGSIPSPRGDPVPLDVPSRMQNLAVGRPPSRTSLD